MQHPLNIFMRFVWTLILLGVALAGPTLAQDTPSKGAEPEATSQAATPSQKTPASDYSLEAVLEQVRRHSQQAQARMAEREAQFQARLQKAQQRLANANARLAAAEDKGRQLEARFDANKQALDDKAQLLSDKLGALKELFGVFQQNASDLIGSFNGSPTSIQYPNRDEWLEGFANRMKNASEVSSVDDIMGLWFEMQREITAAGDIVRLQAPVVGADGEVAERSLVRVGGFNLLTRDPEPAYLVWSDAGQEIVELQRQPASYLTGVDQYLASDSGLQEVGIDPTGGALVSLLVQKPTLIERVHQGGLVGYIILLLGALALLLAAYKLLDIATISLRVRAQQRDLDNPRAGNVLGQLLRVYAANRHVDSETLEMRLHEAVSKGALRVNRFTVFLGIIAAVAPLLGLLGTVVGMINTFQAITLYGTGDPQTMAGGISQALITTILGLVVAVPAVFLHAIVSARAKSVINVLKQQSVALTGDQMQVQNASAVTEDGEMHNPDTQPQPV